MMSSCFETIKSIMGLEFLSNFNIKQLISYFGKMKINALSISNEDLSLSIASGLYLSASSLNHSCYPNSVVIFDGPRLYVKAITDIKKNEEVFHSILKNDNYFIKKKNKYEDIYILH